MKKMLLLMLIFILPALAQYSFDFTCLDDTVKQANFDDYIVFYFQLHNTGSAEDVYEFNCTVIETVPGWYILYCVGGT